MQIRVTGTSEECAAAQEFYRQLGQEPDVKYCTVSKPYPNRGSINQFRVYVNIEYKDGAEPLQRLLDGERA